MPSGSFFEKLKKGMGIEAEEKEMVREKKKKPRKPKKIELEKEPEIIEEKITISQPVAKEEVPAPPEEEPVEEEPAEEEKKKWFEPEGELAIDVYQTDTDLVIQSAIAGVRPEDLDISLERDIITVKGSREKPFEEEGDYFAQECYWGPFSREVILPVEVDPDRAEANMKEGILTIRIPKILREKKRKIKVRI